MGGHSRGMSRAASGAHACGLPGAGSGPGSGELAVQVGAGLCAARGSEAQCLNSGVHPGQGLHGLWLVREAGTSGALGGPAGSSTELRCKGLVQWLRLHVPL